MIDEEHKQFVRDKWSNGWSDDEDRNYYVEREYASGWSFAFGYFETKEEAFKEIDELVDDVAYAVKKGYMDKAYKHNEFRVACLPSNGGIVS